MPTFELVAIITAIVTFLSTKATAWEKVRDLRMPKELRVVNEGVAHDDSHWYFSNQHFLYQTEIDPLNITMTNYGAIPADLMAMGYDHIGDIDIIDGIIYSGIEGKDAGQNALLAKWNTSDLSFISFSTTETNSLPWVAVEPKTKIIYSAYWNDHYAFQMYDIETFEHIGEFRVAENVTLPGEIQGGAFYEGALYIVTNENDEVWRVDMSTGGINLELSDEYEHHVYEMEGIDFWDLRSKGLGVLHMFGNFMQLREKCLRNYKPY